jgi:hypothetical protein
LHFSGVGVGLRVVTGRRHEAGALSVCGGSILFVVSPSPILVIPHHPSSSFPCHLPVVSPSSHRYPLLSLYRSSSLSPCCPIIPRPHCPSAAAATTTREPPHEAGGSFVVDHSACLSCSPLVSSELLLVAELGLGRLVSATIVTSSLESKK